MNIVQREKRIVNNIRFLSEGYGLCALEKMIPSDIPIVFIYGNITEEEINFLNKICTRSCLIAIGETAIYLLKRQIKIDFILLTENVNDLLFKENDCWKEIPLIVDTSVSGDILSNHIGRKFFAFSGSEIERNFYDNLMQQQEALYKYNELIVLPGENMKETMLFLSNFMGDSYTFFIDSDQSMGKAVQIYEGNQRLVEQNEYDRTLEKYFNIHVSIENILSWLIPLFKKEFFVKFCKEYQKLLNEIQAAEKIVNQSIGLYENLYELANQEKVWKEDLDFITAKLNENTLKLDDVQYITYILSISQHVDIESIERDKKNEIAQIALESIESYKKIKYVLQQIIPEQNVIISKENADKDDIKKGDKIENILLVDGKSQYDVLPFFVEGLKKGFQKLDITTYVYITSDMERYKKIMQTGYNHFQNTVGYQYILLMNGVFLEAERYDIVSDNYRNLFDNVNSKVIPMFVDHPFYHMGRLDYSHFAHMVLFTDANWVEYTEHYLKDIPNAIFLPLGGIECQDEFTEFKERENKIVFFGGYSDLKEMQQRIEQHRYSQVIKKILAILIEHPQMTIEMAVDILEKNNNSRYTIHHLVFNTDVISVVDIYIRQYYRQKVVYKIVESGIPIDIYGWNNVAYDNYSNVHLKEAVSLDEMLQICGNTRFVLNVQPWTKSGTQERVFNTMLCGAISVTDDTQYLREHTVDGENILMYQLQELDCLTEKLRYYMEHEEEAEKIAVEGNRLAKRSHTWSNRAEELLEIMKQQRR